MVLCKQNSEDIDHILYRCPYTQHCWDWLRYMLSWNSPMPNSLVNFLKSWPTNIFKGIYRRIWNIYPSILMWEVWKERNRRIFYDQDMQPNEIVKKIEACIVETLNSHLRNSQKEEGSFSSWDGYIKKKWTNFINPLLTCKKKNKEARENCRWTPPPMG